MAIVIDGTGSITGLSAGGLPDGSITASDLASSLDLSGKTVTLPAGVGGKVLQVKTHNLFSTIYISGSTPSTIWTGDSLTLSSSSNKVLTTAHFSIGGSNGGSVKLQFSTNGGSSWSDISTDDMGTTDNGTNMAGVSMLGFHLNESAGAGQYMSIQTSFSYSHSPSSTSVIYRMQAAASDPSYVITFNRRQYDDNWGGLSYITQMEIAA